MRAFHSFIAFDTVRGVAGAVRKLIPRGSNAPIHPDAEQEFLDFFGLGKYVQSSALTGDINTRLKPDVFQDLPSGA